ncbi:MAG: DUF262 domain-containing HNH endonuclease family protein [Hyphomonadaceae bacterium]
MFAQLIDIDWLLSRHYFMPAKVQRQYVWDAFQCERFHNDLLEAYEAHKQHEANGSGTDAPYYLGPIILAKDDKKGVVWVYDGQQRLTTLTIYMAALSQRTKGQVQRKTAELSAAEVKNETRPRMDLRTRGGALTRIVRGTKQRPASLNMPVDWRIYKIEKMLLSRMEQLQDPDDFASWVQRFVTLNALWASNEHGLTLFDRANNRGVKLEWYELVKSVLTEALGDTFKARPKKTINEFWYETARTIEYEFQDLIACTAFIKYRKIDSAQALSAFEDDFDTSKKNQEELNFSGSNLFNSVAVYSETSARLNELRDWKNKGAHNIKNEAELIEFQLSALEFPHWKALLMRADEIKQASERDYRRWIKSPGRTVFLKQLRRLAYIAHLLGWPRWPTRLEYIFDRGLEKMNSGVNNNDTFGLDQIPFSPEQLAQAKGELSTSMSDPRAYRPLVKLWEFEHAFKQRTLDGNALFLAHVEHILPQAPRGDWCRAFPDEDECAELKSKLGNFCLLSKDDNFKIGNDEWEKKRKVYKKTARCFTGAHTVSKESDWTPQIVKLRTQEIARELTQLLEL